MHYHFQVIERHCPYRTRSKPTIGRRISIDKSLFSIHRVIINAGNNITRCIGDILQCNFLSGKDLNPVHLGRCGHIGMVDRTTAVLTGNISHISALAVIVQLQDQGVISSLPENNLNLHVIIGHRETEGMFLKTLISCPIRLQVEQQVLSGGAGVIQIAEPNLCSSVIRITHHIQSHFTSLRNSGGIAAQGYHAATHIAVQFYFLFYTCQAGKVCAVIVIPQSCQVVGASGSVTHHA